MADLTYEQQKEARRDLDKLHGRGEFAHPGNLCYADGYFAKSIEQKFGMPLADLEKALRRVRKAKGRANG